MKFNAEVVRGAWGRACGVVVATALLASCGGSQVEKFHASRVLAFGDEYSVLTAGGAGNGNKYTINSSASSPTGCTLNPIWIQFVGSAFGLVFDACGGPAQNKSWAQPLAKVAGVKAQIDAFQASPGVFTDTDIVTVMAGMNDIKAQYDAYKAAGFVGATDAYVAAVEQAGTDLGAQVVRLTDAGAKVIISTVPDLSFTPFAVAEQTAGQPGFLSTLTKRFNAKLRLKLDDVKGGGRSAGLVAADDLVQFMMTSPTNYGLTNITDAACQPASLPTSCTDLTLVAPINGVTPTAATWLWADALDLGPSGHAQIGSSAATRATSNPF
ncbi:MAG TPA: SGNH/GDSL hydrolase family protein [Rhizobacter sp.]|nr:SGNH/GDSL hydrolase family protein [Rhizobacter sp.]